MIVKQGKVIPEHLRRDLSAQLNGLNALKRRFEAEGLDLRVDLNRWACDDPAAGSFHARVTLTEVVE
jgi:hypothetical protein